MEEKKIECHGCKKIIEGKPNYVASMSTNNIKPTQIPLCDTCYSDLIK